MPRSGQRQTVERGIYRDGHGYEIVARAGRATRSKRFDLGTALESLRRWRDTNAGELRDEAQPTADPKTLDAGITRYLAIRTRKDRDPYKDPLSAWRHLYGPLERRKLTPALCQQAMERWQAEGYAPQTLYYRRLVIQQMWKALDGPKTKTPVDDIHVVRPKGKRPVWVSDQTMLDVLRRLKIHEMGGRLRTPKTRVRFLVLVTTGQRPAQVKRTRRGDVEFWRAPQEGIYGVWWVRAAKGGEPTPVYLNAEMYAAWTAFVVADAWGKYNTRSFAKTLRRCGWPKGVRPYAVRHATGLTLSESGTDLADIQSHFGHTSISTTRTFYVPQLHSRSKQVSQQLEGRFSGVSVAPRRGTFKK